jgi:glycosyltransferase involved in cell wall biosynthesis
MKKTKLLIISDHPLSPSGVGTQTKYMIDYLHKTGKYEFVCLGGAVKHQDYRPQKFDLYGDDLLVIPVDGYGTPEIIRAVLRDHKPDLLWFMTDPRFYEWLWDIEDEVRNKIPMLYYHVWDNYPYPTFNRPFYESNDIIVTMSKISQDIVEKVSPSVKSLYIPLSVDLNVFKKIPDLERDRIRKQHFGDKFLIFWNSRNARRKLSGSLIWWYKDFLDIVGKDKACLLMHTDPKDGHGQDLEAIIAELGLINGEVKFSKNRSPAAELVAMYNAADVTACISDAEGFGMSCSESLACETPVIANMTGGLQEQVFNGEEYFGVGIKPTSKAIIGSQQVPFIYEDRIAGEDFVEALHKLYNMSREERAELGRKGREHLLKNYNQEILMPKWDEVIQDTIKEFGTWETRKYNRWVMKTL